MSPAKNLAARTVLSIFFSLLTVVSIRIAKLFTLPRKTFDRSLMAAFLVSRWGLYVLIFLVAKIYPHGDVDGYFDETQTIFAGGLPYRDLATSYAPLHPYLDWALLHIWYTPKMLILFAIVAESLLIPLWLKLARNFFTERDVRTAALLYLTSALSVQFVTVDGHDNVAVALLFALAIFLILRSRMVASGFMLGTAVAVFKFLPLLYLPAFFHTLKSPFRWLLGVAVPVAIVYGVAVAHHLDVLMPLAREGYRTAHTLPFLVETLLGHLFPSGLWTAVVLLGLAALLLVIFQAMKDAPQQARLRLLTLAIAAVTILLLFIPKKSWPPYFMLSLFPVSLMLAPLARWKITLFAAFQCLCIALPSIWAEVFSQAEALPMHVLLFTRSSAAVPFFLGEIVMVAGYIALLFEALRQIRGWRDYPAVTDGAGALAAPEAL